MGWSGSRAGAYIRQVVTVTMHSELVTGIEIKRS